MLREKLHSLDKFEKPENLSCRRDFELWENEERRGTASLRRLVRSDDCMYFIQHFETFSNPFQHFSNHPKLFSNFSILRCSERIPYSAHKHTLHPPSRPPCRRAARRLLACCTTLSNLHGCPGLLTSMCVFNLTILSPYI